MVIVSLKLFSSKKEVIEFYTHIFKDLKPMLCNKKRFVAAYECAQFYFMCDCCPSLSTNKIYGENWDDFAEA